MQIRGTNSPRSLTAARLVTKTLIELRPRNPQFWRHVNPLISLFPHLGAGGYSDMHVWEQARRKPLMRTLLGGRPLDSQTFHTTEAMTAQMEAETYPKGIPICAVGGSVQGIATSWMGHSNISLKLTAIFPRSFRVGGVAKEQQGQSLFS